MKIAFYQPHLDIRGTGVAYFDYAYYNEKILGNKSLMICDKGDSGTHPLIEKKFKEALTVIELPGHENMELLNEVLIREECDALYIQKKGRKDDGRFTDVVPTFIHCCGVEFDPHGTVYAYVSEWLSKVCTGGKYPFVLPIVNLPNTDSNMRQELNIPNNAIVFGRIGGFDTWNIKWVNKVIKKIVKRRDDIYFLFASTPKFINHPRVIFLDSFADEVKVLFINSCDALLHARHAGESFGMVVGEFSSRNKPVITWNGSKERAHIDTLGDRGIYYSNPRDLYKILMNFKPMPDKDWNCYKANRPEIVMKKFKEVFIDKIPQYESKK